MDEVVVVGIEISSAGAMMGYVSAVAGRVRAVRCFEASCV